VERTSLSHLESASLVNLELPTRAGTPLGGHVVQGHVDGVGKLVELAKIPGGDDWKLVVELPPGLDRYVVHKGSIAIEGISLTVAKVEERRVTVAIIPHTYEATNLHSLKIGAPMNVEVDILAKYAEKMFQGEKVEGVTMERLISEGF
jgi:riboflavin synthase